MAEVQKSVQELVADAQANIKLYSAEEAIDRHEQGDVVFLDVRDEPELERYGKIPGAVNASRGMLEFYADPATPFYKDVFDTDKEIIAYCAVGLRGALATQRLTEMGYESVASLDGGIEAWQEADGPIEEVSDVQRLKADLEDLKDVTPTK